LWAALLLAVIIAPILLEKLTILPCAAVTLTPPDEDGNRDGDY